MQRGGGPAGPPGRGGGGAAAPATFQCAGVFTNMAAAVQGDAVGTAASLGANIRFSVAGADGSHACWLLQAATSPASLAFEGAAPGAAPAQLTVTAADAVMAQLGSGQLTAQQAFMRGKLKLKGNMALATKLGGLLQSAGGAQGKL